MREVSDEELYEIVKFGSEDDFIFDAIAAAKNEFERRNLSSEKQSEIAQIIQNKREQERIMSEKPLSWPGRIAFFIISSGLITIIILSIIAGRLESRGYSRKSSEAYKWMGAGVIFWIGLGVILYLFG
jgi:hypothetical protein